MTERVGGLVVELFSSLLLSPFRHRGGSIRRLYVYTCVCIYIPSLSRFFYPLPLEGGYVSTPPRPTSTLSREFPINSLIKVDRLARRKEGWMWNMERSGSARNGTLDLLTAFSCSLCLFPASRRVTERPAPPRDLRLVAISE